MSKIHSLIFVAVLCGAPIAATSAFAQPGNNPSANAATSGHLVPVTDKTDGAWLAKARAEYPLTTCSVSGDKLDGGDMGKPLDYVYQQGATPDRLIRFCCKDCVKDFKKDPAKYLKAIDDAAAAKSKQG